jgi:hypothetical protein
MPQNMVREQIELNLKPIPPDTVDSVKEEVRGYIEKILKDEGQYELVTSGELKIEDQKTFPVDEVIKIIITVVSPIALEVFKKTLLPRIEQRYQTWLEERSKKENNKE